MNSLQATNLDPLNAEGRDTSNQKSTNHWKDIVLKYERRNASLEHRQSQLSERLQAMECALPSILMSAMVSMHYGTEPPKMDLESVLSKSGFTSDNRQVSSKKNPSKPDNLQIELVYKRTEDSMGENHQIPDPGATDGSAKNQSIGNSRFATGDDGRLHREGVGPGDPEAPGTQFGRDEPDMDSVVNLSVMSSRDLMALGRIQELAEQERLLKRYICDLESRERTFCETLERANRLLSDPLEGVEECAPICSGAEAKEPISDDPVMQRLQKLEFYNKRMIASMKGLRQEKNVLIKQTELLKTELRNTQEKLGEVQKEVLGEAKVITVMGEPSLTGTALKGICSCASTSNKENSSGENSSPKTLSDLAEQFEDVLEKAKNHGLCKLSGTIKVAAMKLKELSKSEEGHKCNCNCPCDPVFKQDGPCPNCKCGKFDMDKFGETGDWFCDSCGGECVCDLVSLDDEDSVDTNQGKKAKGCECGCQDDRIPCECGCEISNINEVGEAGDIPKTIARKLSEDLKGIICKDCGNCKCGDDHSNCPNCIEACTCSCKTDTVPELSKKTEIQLGRKEREPQDLDVCGPHCACSDLVGADSPESDVLGELRKKLVFSSGKKGNPDLHPCFECEQPEPCDVCLEEELSRLKPSKTIVRFGLQESIHLEPIPCKECLIFGTTSNKDRAKTKISLMCNLCREHESATFETAKTFRNSKTGDKTEREIIHDSKCPCSCDETVPSNIDQCLCGCGVDVKADEKTDNSCPCGCGQTPVRLSDSFEESGCDCECAKGGVHCDYCCCVESIVKLLNADKMAHDKSPETCPCIEDSIRKTEVENLAKILQQDVDCIGKKNNVLRQLVAQCASAAPEIIEESSPTVGCPYHDPTPIRPTISGLQAAIELLRSKSRSKDGMIAVLAESLEGKVDPGKIIEKLVVSTPTEIFQDFDQCRLYNYLKGSGLRDENTILSQSEYLPPQVEKEEQKYGENSEMFWSQSAIPQARDFKVVKQICNDSLLVTWTPPNDISKLNGYEIRVNGYVVNRVRSPTRTEALLISLDTSRPMLLTLYSLGPGGSSSDPMRITYPGCPCVDD